MIRERWSEADITAYLDGQLEPDRLTVFEKTLAQSSVLRQRVDALRKTLAVLRETPLREAPRNYLLSPSMVANPKPARQSRPWSIGFMRLATSLTAAAFALTMGLNVLNRGLAPSVFMEQSESLQVMENGAVMKEDAGDTIIRESEEPVLMIAADTPTSKTETIQEEALAVEEPAAELESEPPVSEGVMEAAPVAGVEAEDAVGMGGEADQPEAPQVEGEMKVAPESAVEADDATGAEGEGEEPAALEMAESPEIPEEESVLGAVEEDEPERTLVDEDAVEDLDYAADEVDGGQSADDSNNDAELAAPGEMITEIAPETGQDARTPPNLFWRLVRVTPPQWVPISLGILTIVLFGVTVLISPRRR